MVGCGNVVCALPKRIRNVDWLKLTRPFNPDYSRAL